MQVVQPKPTRLKPSLSRSFCSPDLSRYSATTCEPGASEVFTHGFDGQALGHRLAGQQAGAHHHVRIRRIGAGGDRGDHHVAMTEIVLSALDRHAFREPALEKFLSNEVASEGCRSKISLPPSPPLLNSFSIAMAKPAFTSLSATRSCGRFGPASDGSTCDEIELEHVGEDRVGRGLAAVHALRLGIGGDQRNARGRPAGVRRDMSMRIVIDREEAAGRAVFRRHVADGGAVGDREIGEAGTEDIRRTCRPRRACAASG